MAKKRKITTLVDRFGSNRENAERPGELLRGCSCITIPCAGGMCEVPHMTANIINCNDKDLALMNLAKVVRTERARLVEMLDLTPVHAKELVFAQQYCRQAERERVPLDSFAWAYHYFVASWMSRGGTGGTKQEFDGGLSIRYKSGGGDSVVRFRNATAALAEWEPVMRRCTFTSMDAFDLIAECLARDIPENGLYVDPDWLDDGDNYKHHVEPVKLRDALEKFQHTKIVVRYGVHPAIEQLYQHSKWRWVMVESRTQANSRKQEVLLVSNR